MNVASLLQDTPSEDRAKRQSKAATTKPVQEPQSRITPDSRPQNYPPEYREREQIPYNRPLPTAPTPSGVPSSGPPPLAPVPQTAPLEGGYDAAYNPYHRPPSRPSAPVRSAPANGRRQDNPTQGPDYGRWSGQEPRKEYPVDEYQYEFPRPEYGRDKPYANSQSSSRAVSTASRFPPRGPEILAPTPVAAIEVSRPVPASNVPQPLLPPPRTPSPKLEPVHYGTFVYPNTPFPIKPTPETLPLNRRTTFTLVIPFEYIPHPPPIEKNVEKLSSLIHPHHPPPSILPPLTPALPHTNPLSSLYDPRSIKIWGGIPTLDSRKMYTDDSDLVWAALHSGVITWDTVRRQRRKGECELVLGVRVWNSSANGRWPGGEGSNGVKSFGWGFSHEGAGYGFCDPVAGSVINLPTPPAPVTTKTHLAETQAVSDVKVTWRKNDTWKKVEAGGSKRKKSMMEAYAQRRSALFSSASTSLINVPISEIKTRNRAIHSELLGSGNTFQMDHTILAISDDEEQGETERGLESVEMIIGQNGFSYAPSTIQSILFPSNASKKRRLNNDATTDEPFWRHTQPLEQRGPNIEAEMVLDCPDAERLIFRLCSSPATEEINGQKRAREDSYPVYNVYVEVRRPEEEPIQASVVRFETPLSTVAKWKRSTLVKGVAKEDVEFGADGVLIWRKAASELAQKEGLFYVVEKWRWRETKKVKGNKGKLGSVRRVIVKRPTEEAPTTTKTSKGGEEAKEQSAMEVEPTPDPPRVPVDQPVPPALAT